MSKSYNGFDAKEFTLWLQDFLVEGKTQMFANASGETLLIFESFANWRTDDEKYLNNALFVSHDGVTFRQMQSLGYGGNSIKHDRSYEDPVSQSKCELSFKDGVYTRDDGERFTDVDVEFPGNVVFVPVPEVRVPEYLFRFEDGRYVYVDAVKYGYAYEHFRLFIGTADDMQQKDITYVARYRDGGTTIIHVDDGVLFTPPPFNKDAKPLWSNDSSVSANDFLQCKVHSAEPLERFDRTEKGTIALIQTFVLHESNKIA
ncbi:hypothetical protein KKG65_00460 [Patescibacteria group bacterium]|nr:hypothetical protein [Patescibacteria group bacterium]